MVLQGARPVCVILRNAYKTAYTRGTMKQKIKYNRKPLIILLCFAIAFVIAAVVCFVMPKMIKIDAPLQLSNNKLTMTYVGNDQYGLSGKLKNVSEDTITIKNNGGMTVYFEDSNDVFDDGWLENNSDITLLPGEVYDFSECIWALNGKSTITKVLVTVDGETYNLIVNTNTYNVLMLIFILFAFVFLILAITQDKNMRNNAIKKNAVLDLCTASGEKSYLFTVSVADKSESKKAAAKTAGWVAGAVLTTLFTGVGVYRVYSGTTMTDFVLSEHHLYSVNGSSQQGMAALTPVTREDYPTASVEIKKKNVVVHHVDGKKSLTFIRDKKCELSLEQIAEYLNNVLVKPLPQSEVDGYGETATTGADPFDEFTPAQIVDTKSPDDGFGDKEDK